MPNHWLIKSEPSVYSIDDLERDGETCWDGVRNYQARNFMRDGMRVGDPVLFYHSNADPPAVVGLARVCRAAYPDATAWDPQDAHFDPQATPERPIWVRVDVAFARRLARPVTLARLRDDPALEGLLLTRRGSRLSVLPVSGAHVARILALAE